MHSSASFELQGLIAGERCELVGELNTAGTASDFQFSVLGLQTCHGTRVARAADMRSR